MKTRDEKIHAGLMFMDKFGLVGERYKDPKIKDFWIRLETLINEKLDGKPEELENFEFAETLFGQATS